MAKRFLVAVLERGIFLQFSNSSDFHLRQISIHTLCACQILRAYSLLEVEGGGGGARGAVLGGCFLNHHPGSIICCFLQFLLFGVTPSEVSIIHKARRATELSSSTGKWAPALMLGGGRCGGGGLPVGHAGGVGAGVLA